MTGNNLVLYSHIASYLTHHFGYQAMEVVAAKHLIFSLLKQLHAQTGTNVDQVSDCMNEAFDALIQSRGLSIEHVAKAHDSFRHLTACQKEQQRT